MSTLSDRASSKRAGVLRATQASIVGLGVAWVAACGLEEPGPMDADPVVTGKDTLPRLADTLPRLAIVSDPAASGPAGPASATLASPDDEVVYVSLPPGSLGDGSGVDVRNRASGFHEIIPLVNGGFDPVGIPGSAGDTLDFVVTMASIRPHEWSEVVPLSSPPTIVRSEPSRGKRDVPVALSPLVVFSEPMGPTTLTPDAVHLLHDGDIVAGRVVFADSLHIATAFVPDAPLSGMTTYDLIITRESRDVDGESIEEEQRISFTTGAAPTPVLSIDRAAGVSGDRQADTVLATLADPLRVVVLRDGVPASGVDVAWAQLFVTPVTLDGQGTSTLTRTDSAGVASVRVRLGSLPGAFHVQASVAGAVGSPVRFVGRINPGNPVGIVAQAGGAEGVPVGTGGGQVGLVNVSFREYVARVTDAYGNGVAGVTPTWTVISGGGTVTPVWRPWGDHTAVATPAADGEQVVAATLPGGANVRFRSSAVSALVIVTPSGDSDCHESGFEPQNVVIPTGATVGWVWCDQGIGDSYPHDVTFEDGIESSPTLNWDWPNHVRRFTAPGVYRYRCTLHSTDFDDNSRGEVGTVTVS